MSEKDIKVKPQTTTKTVKNAPKSVQHSAKTAVKDIKTVARDTLVKNVMDKQLDTKHTASRYFESAEHTQASRAYSQNKRESTSVCTRKRFKGC